MFLDSVVVVEKQGKAVLCGFKWEGWRDVRTDTLLFEGAVESLYFAVFLRAVGGIQSVLYVQFFEEIANLGCREFFSLICPDLLYREGSNVHHSSEEVNGVFCVGSSLVETGKSEARRIIYDGIDNPSLLVTIGIAGVRLEFLPWGIVSVELDFPTLCGSFPLVSVAAILSFEYTPYRGWMEVDTVFSLQTI